MGNFEKLSVLVIVCIVVMILVAALHTWATEYPSLGKVKHSVEQDSKKLDKLEQQAGEKSQAEAEQLRAEIRQLQEQTRKNQERIKLLEKVQQLLSGEAEKAEKEK